jgi:hypothetical protein
MRPYQTPRFGNQFFNFAALENLAYRWAVLSLAERVDLKAAIGDSKRPYSRGWYWRGKNRIEQTFQA